MMGNPNDTQDKVFLKDHDILIAVYTQLNDLIRRFDDNVRAETERSQAIAVEMKGIALEQVRVSTELKNLQTQSGELDKRMDALESKSRNMDIVSYVLVTIAGLIAWFKQ